MFKTIGTNFFQFSEYLHVSWNRYALSMGYDVELVFSQGNLYFILKVCGYSPGQT